MGAPPELRVGVVSEAASALIQIDGDNTRGGLPVPRMTTTERDAIATPATGLLVFNTTTDAYNFYSGAAWVSLGSSSGGAPADATYITQTPNSGLSAEQALSALATGAMQVTTTTGVVSSRPNSVTSTATAAGTTTLTNTSEQNQIFTGTTTQNCVLPNATTLALGWTFRIFNQSTGAVTVKDGSGSTLVTLLANQTVTLYCSGIGSAAGTWLLSGSAATETLTNKTGLGMSVTTGLAPGAIASTIANLYAGVQMDYAPTDFTNANAAINIGMEFTSASNLPTPQRVINATLRMDGTGGSSAQTIAAIVGTAQGNQTASTIIHIRGIQGGASLINSANAPALEAFASLLAVTSSGVVTNGYDYRALAPTLSSTGTMTSHYGFGADNLGNAKQTNSYAFYAAAQSGSTTGNYLLYGAGAGITHLSDTLEFDGQAARTINSLRNTTSNTAGNSLTIQSGGATSAATDKSAGALVLAAGLSTGNAAPGLVKLQSTVPAAASGTGDQTLVDRQYIGSFKALTNNSATTILNFTNAASGLIGGVVHYTIIVTDGTDYQVETGSVYVSGYNKGGAFSVTATEVNSQQNASSGTLATTWAISSANPAALSINANSSLTPSTGYPQIFYTVHNLSRQAIAAA